MNLPEITPEIAIQATQEAASLPVAFGLAVGEIMSTDGMPEVFASIMLVWNDILTNDCHCESCDRMREILSNTKNPFDGD